jgi:hypothetical protein
MIPNECYKDIKTVLDRNQAGLHKNRSDIHYLMTVYITYVVPPRFMTIEKKVTEQMRCGKCRAYVWKFFNDGRYLKA